MPRLPSETSGYRKWAILGVQSPWGGKQVILLLQALPHWAADIFLRSQFQRQVFEETASTLKECLSFYRVCGRKRQTPQGTSQNNKNSQQQQQRKRPANKQQASHKAKQGNMIFFVSSSGFQGPLSFKEPYQNSLPENRNNKK